MKNRITNTETQSGMSSTKPSADNIQSNSSNANEDMSINEPTFNTGVVVSLTTNQNNMDCQSSSQDSINTQSDGISVNIKHGVQEMASNVKNQDGGDDMTSQEVDVAGQPFILKPINGHLLETVTKKKLDYYLKGNGLEDGKVEECMDLGYNVASALEEERGLKRLRTSAASVGVEV